uniref:Ovule protein n=1 Tax=Mesocestoides corti TaxID=53468 RepID=A0A5K3EVE5_MESCO
LEFKCCESCFFTTLNSVAPPPTQGSTFRNLSPATRILNSPLICMIDYLELSPHLGLDVSACMTNTSEV